MPKPARVCGIPIVSVFPVLSNSAPLETSTYPWLWLSRDANACPRLFTAMDRFRPLPPKKLRLICKNGCLRRNHMRYISIISLLRCSIKYFFQPQTVHVEFFLSPFLTLHQILQIPTSREKKLHTKIPRNSFSGVAVRPIPVRVTTKGGQPSLLTFLLFSCSIYMGHTPLVCIGKAFEALKYYWYSRSLKRSAF